MSGDVRVWRIVDMSGVVVQTVRAATASGAVAASRYTYPSVYAVPVVDAADATVALVNRAADDVLGAIGGGTDRDRDLINLVVNVIAYRVRTNAEATVAAVIAENYESEGDVLEWFE